MRQQARSHVRIRASISRPPVMLVRIDAGEEPVELGLGDLPVDVLRVRHPLPACERIRVIRPVVVVLGQGVREQDAGDVRRAAHEIGAKVLALGPLVSRESLGAWVRDAVEEVTRRRCAELLEEQVDDLPSTRPPPFSESALRTPPVSAPVPTSPTSEAPLRRQSAR